MTSRPRSRLLFGTVALGAAGVLGVTFALAAPAAPNDRSTVAGPVADGSEAPSSWEDIEQPKPDTTSTPPQTDPFYQPPDPLPDGEPGDIIRSEPADAFTDALRARRFPADAWRVMYLSTGADGEPMAVTGTVMVPHAEWEGEGERPVLSYAVGTHGMGDHCAPSYSLKLGLDYEASMVERVVRSGWAMVIPDYEQLGTPGDHTYMVGKSQGPAVLDSLRAATRLPDAGLPEDAPMGITGYSQGGGASVWAAEMQPEYAPELPLAGVAAGGVPADLNRVAENLDGSLYFAFLGFAALGYSEAYPELPLEEHLNTQGKVLMKTARNTCLVDSLPAGAGRSMDDLTTDDVLGMPEWQKRLAENRPGDSAPEVPLYLYQSSKDDVIPADQAADLRADYCAAGGDVRWRETRSGPHITSMFADFGPAREWMGDRLAGEADPGNCA